MITGQQVAVIARIAMARKAKGLVPTVAASIIDCPKATLNPETGEPFSKKVILEVFKTRCFDNDPERPWVYVNAKQKTCLSPDAKVARIVWADVLLAMNHQAVWYFRHIVWFDPCHSIIPGQGQNRSAEQSQIRMCCEQLRGRERERERERERFRQAKEQASRQQRVIPNRSPRRVQPL